MVNSEVLETITDIAKKDDFLLLLYQINIIGLKVNVESLETIKSKAYRQVINNHYKDAEESVKDELNRQWDDIHNYLCNFYQTWSASESINRVVEILEDFMYDFMEEECKSNSFKEFYFLFKKYVVYYLEQMCESEADCTLVISVNSAITQYINTKLPFSEVPKFKDYFRSEVKFKSKYNNWEVTKCDDTRGLPTITYKVG